LEKGRLIVFEGVDAAGKTALCNELCDTLLKKQIPVQRNHFPGKTPGTLGEVVYRIHHDHEKQFGVSSIIPCALQLLHIAAHVDVIKSSIKPAINKGKWVILDRFWWSTYVYGFDSGINKKSLELMIEIEKYAWGLTLPDVVFLIDSTEPLRDDVHNCISWQRKRKAYLELAEKEDSSYRSVRIQNKRGQNAKNKALEMILHEVL